MNTIFECLNVFFGRERDHQPSTYATGGWMGEGHPKCVQLYTLGKSVTPHAYVRIYTISFHVFLVVEI